MLEVFLELCGKYFIFNCSKLGFELAKKKDYKQNLQY